MLASTAAILVLAGWPLSIDRGCMNVASSAGGRNPATASVVYSAAAAWPLDSTSRSRSGSSTVSGLMFIECR